jgi:predicted RNase H-like HicB family nuclease
MAVQERTFTAHIIEEDGVFVAQCLEVDVVSQGATLEEALRNIREAVALYCESFGWDEEPKKPRSVTISQFQVPCYA